jgi:hypothetical protein
LIARFARRGFASTLMIESDRGVGSMNGYASRGRVTLAAVACLVLCAPLVAHAAGGDDDAIIKRGVELRRKSQDREALAEFQRALAIRETPRVIAQIGLAEDALGLWLSAEEHLTRALRNQSDPWIVRNVAPLRQALTAVSEHIGSVEIWGEPAGAAVVINGKVVGALHPAAVARVAAGTCTVVVRAEGYEELTRSIQVKAGVLVRENVQLVPTSSRRPSWLHSLGGAWLVPGTSCVRDLTEQECELGRKESSV